MQLLNANSYQKGGWYCTCFGATGREAFWKGIRNYYAKYDGGNANTDDLRTIMEQAGGKDLKEFFKQWLYTPGIPQLDITWKFDASKARLELHITQKQARLFDFPWKFTIGDKTAYNYRWR